MTFVGKVDEHSAVGGETDTIRIAGKAVETRRYQWFPYCPSDSENEPKAPPTNPAEFDMLEFIQRLVLPDSKAEDIQHTVWLDEHGILLQYEVQGANMPASQRVLREYTRNPPARSRRQSLFGSTL
jgi:hypothetical protein